MEPKGLKSSCKSVSRVSSDRLVTRMVALSSARHQARRSSYEGPGQRGPYPQDHHWVLGGACPQVSIWGPHCLTSAVGLHGLPTAAGPIPQARWHVLPCLVLGCLHRLQLWRPKAVGSGLTLAQQRDSATQDAGVSSPGPAQALSVKAAGTQLVPQRPGGHDDIRATSRKPAVHRAEATGVDTV